MSNLKKIELIAVSLLLDGKLNQRCLSTSKGFIIESGGTALTRPDELL